MSSDWESQKIIQRQMAFTYALIEKVKIMMIQCQMACTHGSVSRTGKNPVTAKKIVWIWEKNKRWADVILHQFIIQSFNVRLRLVSSNFTKKRSIKRILRHMSLPGKCSTIARACQRMSLPSASASRWRTTDNYCMLMTLLMLMLQPSLLRSIATYTT